MTHILLRLGLLSLWEVAPLNDWKRPPPATNPPGGRPNASLASIAVTSKDDEAARSGGPLEMSPRPTTHPSSPTSWPPLSALPPPAAGDLRGPVAVSRRC